MRPNITKAFYLFLFLLSFGKIGFSQLLNHDPVLINVSLDLGPDGVIYDVAEDPYNDFYVIVGDFSSVNGQTAHNIAFLNRSDLSVATVPTGAITQIDGIIRSVAIKRNYVSSGGPFPVFSIQEVMYIGGNFSTVNNSSHKGIAKLIRPYSGFTYATLYGLNGWNPQMLFTPLNVESTAGANPEWVEGVHDIILARDTVILAGDFTFDVGLPHSGMKSLCAFLNTDNTWVSNLFSSFTFASSQPIIYKIQKDNNHFFISGLARGTNSYPLWYEGSFVQKLNSDGTKVSAAEFSAYPSGGQDGNQSILKNFEIITNPTNSLIFTNKIDVYYAPNQSHRKVYQYSGSPYSSSCSGESIACSSYSNNYETNIAQYKNYLYRMENLDLGYNDFKTSFNLPITNFDNITLVSPDVVTSASGIRGLNVVSNKLFVSLPNLETAGGDPHEGLAVYCLEPKDAEFFTVSDSLVCSGDTIIYTIPTVEFADGYLWEYTGTGVDINLTGGPNMDDFTTSNSVSIAYLSNFTTGQLKVTPYSDCNNTTVGGEKVYSNTIITNIGSNPLPNAYAGVDTTLNCLRDSLVLVGSSSSPNTSYAWLDNSTGFVNITGTDSLVSTVSGPFASGTEYIFQVTDDILGCVNYDTVIVTLDETPPNVTLPALPWEITCANTTITLVGGSSTNGVSFSWNGPSGTIADTTLIADGSMVGNWYLTVTDTTNGCSLTESSTISNNINAPTPELIHLESLTTYFPIPLTMPEILTCDNDSIIYVCTTQTPNSVAEWKDANGVFTGSDTIIITAAGNYIFNVKDTINGCDLDKTITVNGNFDLPILTMPILNTINCSRDTLVLGGLTISLDTTLVWNGPTYTNETNPLTTNQTGWHYFTVTRGDNGCSLTDSIEIVFEPTIDVFADDDTLICSQTDVTLGVTYDGILSNVVYNWNNGGSSSSSVYNSGTSDEATVIVSADNGCIGYDTVKISVPTPPDASFQSFSPCDGGASGKIIVTAIDGLNPYTYSIANGAFQPSTLFENLAIGSYSIDVADSIGCLYNFNAEITAVGQLPEPLFIFSTYNVQADTVVLVDVSTPPADYIDWVFPFEVTVFDDSNINSPVIILPDTGAFEITMNAHYGSCIIPITKWIYSADYDSTLATNYNQNGIKSVELYPNPNTGVFTVEIEFYKRQHSVTTVQDMNGYSYYWEENNEDDLIVTHQIDLGANIQPGTYVLKVASEFDSYYITFVVN